ncbi:MAG: hypothetical protein JHC95_19905 [Solirubrobacteraceae bacterium]|nr:hypothetical protein [Solirubrobacteraceae bacterium]
MSTWRALTDFFVAPAVDGPPVAPPSAPAVHAAAGSQPTVGLLCPARSAATLPAVVAIRLARRGSVALALVWTGGTPGAGGRAARGTRGARRLAQDLEGRGVTARAAGRAVLVDLPAEPLLAVAEIGAAQAVAPDVASVLVLTGPRDDTLEHLLAQCDVVLVADAPGVPDALSALAVAGLQERGLAARACALPSPRTAALTLRTGALTPGARRLLDGALEGVA